MTSSMAGLYADGAITAREWIAARDPITARITQTRREIAAAPDTTAVYELAGAGGILRDQWRWPWSGTSAGHHQSRP